ncbi:MAG: methyltransferase domain-containing protein [Candidatus Aerophobetes bacterium]|nr:methyltransferase domain-containing protein [Candidatus Aerophobetes bacterium]
MSLTKFIRDVQKRYEAIPTPGAIVYNATAAKILRKPERKIAEDIVEKMGSGTILDLGSGTGYLSIEIAKRATSLKVYGVDLSKGMVKIARHHAKGVENAQFEFGNVADLPFEDDSIDFIVSTGSLHHWRKSVKVFDECYRVLKSGKEAWIYDGCAEGAEQYGFPHGLILRKILEAHGFTLAEYKSEIKSLWEQTKFKGSYRMKQTDIWMKIILKKYR